MDIVISLARSTTDKYNVARDLLGKVPNKAMRPLCQPEFGTPSVGVGATPPSAPPRETPTRTPVVTPTGGPRCMVHPHATDHDTKNCKALAFEYGACTSWLYEGQCRHPGECPFDHKMPDIDFLAKLNPTEFETNINKAKQRIANRHEQRQSAPTPTPTPPPATACTAVGVPTAPRASRPFGGGSKFIPIGGGWDPCQDYDSEDSVCCVVVSSTLGDPPPYELSV